MLKLMEPIFCSKDLKGIPKMIITQFCRGESMMPTTQIDKVTLSKDVNGQAGEKFIRNNCSDGCSDDCSDSFLSKPLITSHSLIL